MLLSTKKSWPIKELLGVFARSIGQVFFVKVWGQDFSQKSEIKSRRFFLESLGPKNKKIPFFGDRKRKLCENLGKSVDSSCLSIVRLTKPVALVHCLGPVYPLSEV